LQPRTKFTYPSVITAAALPAAFVISKILWFIRYRGTYNTPRANGGFVVASNHATYIDPAWLSVPIRSQLRYMAWNKAMEWPLVDPFIRHLGAFPVKHRAHITKSAVAEALSSLKDGAALIVFPEDDRKFDDGRLLEFKSGAVHIAMHAGVPITPVSIRGAQQSLAAG